MSEDKLKLRLAEFMSRLSVEPSKKELDEAVKGVFKDKKKTSKEGEEKPKRQLSAWNIFYKEQSAILKAEEEGKDKDERMSAKEKMSYIASLWKSKSSNQEEHETFQEAHEEPVPEQEQEQETEPMAKTSAKPANDTGAKFTKAKTSNKFSSGDGSKKKGKDSDR